VDEVESALPHYSVHSKNVAKTRPLSLDKILYGFEINSLRNILSPEFCYEFVPCSISCGFGLACSFAWFGLVEPC
jgi:hypothetical protein